MPRMRSAEKASTIKRLALACGFDRAGVARLEPSERGGALLTWLERGAHAGMAYMERRVEARLDPREILEGARSVLCVALQYEPREGAPASGDLWPGVARYAHGRDYHDLMTPALKELAERVATAFPGCGARWYVDTGPVLERELAASAGIGAVGKNTMLLHPEAGSWFLLGELFLTLELEPDPPMADPCGSCTRCLEACPTDALSEPYFLDTPHRGQLFSRSTVQAPSWFNFAGHRPPLPCLTRHDAALTNEHRGQTGVPPIAILEWGR